MLVELERQAIECDFVGEVRLPCPSDETNAYDKEHSDESKNNSQCVASGVQDFAWLTSDECADILTTRTLSS